MLICEITKSIKRATIFIVNTDTNKCGTVVIIDVED